MTARPQDGLPAGRLHLDAKLQRGASVEPDDRLTLVLRPLDHADEAWSCAYVRLPRSARALLHVLASFPDAVVREDLEAAFAGAGPALGARHPFDPTLRVLHDEFVRIERPDETTVTVRLRDAGLEAFMARQLERDLVAARVVIESAGFVEQVTHVWRLITRRGSRTALDGVFADAAARLLRGPSFAWRSRPEWPAPQARLSAPRARRAGRRSANDGAITLVTTKSFVEESPNFDVTATPATSHIVNFDGT